HESPTPSPSPSVCAGLETLGQLSTGQVFAGYPGLPKPSPSGSVQESSESRRPSPSASGYGPMFNITAISGLHNLPTARSSLQSMLKSFAAKTLAQSIAG